MVIGKRTRKLAKVILCNNTGTYIYPNGDTYEGEWSNEKNGKGKR